MENIPHTENGILRFIDRRMVVIRQRLPNPYQFQDWPGNDRELELAQWTDGLSIWARVACTFLADGTDDQNVMLV